MVPNWIFKLGRHYANHAIRNSAEVPRFSNNSRVGRKLLTPQSIADQNHMGVAVLLLPRKKAAAQDGLCPKQREQIRARFNFRDQKCTARRIQDSQALAREGYLGGFAG